MHRLFVAIRPPESIRDLLIDIMDDSPQLRWVGDEQLHLTLRFIGEVERPLANDVADSLSRIRIPQFQLRICGLGRFEQRNGGALWAGVEPRAKVSELAAKIDRACVQAGLEPERRAFHPHITLARWNRSGREAAADFERRQSQLTSPQFAVDEFILFESHLSRHGPHYDPVTAYPLI
jgi:2'-5' RNA ligase